MALIKTDSQNYTGIADALREVTGGTEKYKPEEMSKAIQGLFMEYGVSYDSFDSDGNVLTATTYGNKIYGLGGLSKLYSFNFSGTEKSVAPFAFWASGDILTTSKAELVIPEGVEKIEKNGLTGTWYNAIILPDSVTELSEGCLSSNMLMNSLHLSANITKIPTAAITFCTTLDELTIPAKVDTIDMMAFTANGLKSVTFLGTPSTINANAFYICSDLTTINVPWAEGEVANAPWGAENATINYNYVAE